MIRINLLPGAKKGARAGGGGGGGGGMQGWIAAYVAAVVITGFALGGAFWLTRSELVEKEARNADSQRKITEAKKRVGDVEGLKAKLKRSQDLETVVADLQKARLGPTRMLMEISKILSVGGGPTIDPERLATLRRTNPLAGSNPGWDPRRLWVTEFTETDLVCEIKGVGKTNADVAEFFERLNLSDSFESVQLTKTERVLDEKTLLPLIQFEFDCRVRY